MLCLHKCVQCGLLYETIFKSRLQTHSFCIWASRFVWQLNSSFYFVVDSVYILLQSQQKWWIWMQVVTISVIYLLSVRNYSLNFTTNSSPCFYKKMSTIIIKHLFFWSSCLLDRNSIVLHSINIPNRTSQAGTSWHTAAFNIKYYLYLYGIWTSYF